MQAQNPHRTPSNSSDPHTRGFISNLSFEMKHLVWGSLKYVVCNKNVHKISRAKRFFSSVCMVIFTEIMGFIAVLFREKLQVSVLNPLIALPNTNAIPSWSSIMKYINQCNQCVIRHLCLGYCVNNEHLSVLHLSVSWKSDLSWKSPSFNFHFSIEWIVFFRHEQFSRLIFLGQ